MQQIPTATVASKKQFEYLYRLKSEPSLTHYFQQFLAILSSCFFFSTDKNKHKNEVIHPDVYRIADRIQLLLHKNYDDLQIYTELNRYFHKEILPKLSIKGNTHTLHLNGARTTASYRNERAERRVSNLIDLLDTDTKTINHYLDLGCSQGEITGLMGKTLNLVPSNIYGCDLADATLANASKNPDLPYTYLQSSHQHIPLATQSVELLTALMVLHHLNHPEMLQEIHRILKPNGFLVIREHDCPLNQPWFTVIFDVMHGMWNYVWSETPEEDDFINNYHASYRCKEAFTDELTKIGFRLLLDTEHRKHWYHHGESPDLNPLQSYYAIYQKEAIRCWSLS